MAKQKGANEEELTSEEMESILKASDTDSEDSGNAKIRIIVGPFEALGDDRRWHITSSKIQWGYGKISASFDKKLGEFVETYPTESYHTSLFEAIESLIKQIYRTLGDITIDSSADDYFDKIRLLQDAYYAVAVGVNKATHGLGIMIHYDKRLLEKNLGKIEAKITNKYLNGGAGKDIAP